MENDPKKQNTIAAEKGVHPRASWTITLEYKASDEPSPVWSNATLGNNDAVTVQKKNSWRGDGEQRPVDECLTLDLAHVIKMLHESGVVLAPSAEGVIKAFGGAWK